MRVPRFDAVLIVAVATSVAVLRPAPAAAQERDFSTVEIKTEKVAEGVYMLAGAGGNIGVSAGEDGVFLIDDQYAPLTDKIRAAVTAISPKPIRFLINTHWHGDHTGGNENMGNAGVVIVAHENVRRRMSAEQFIAAFNRKVPPSPAKALPIVTFTDAVTFHLNGDDLRSFHVAPAHTDGDTVIHFRKANVVHGGDVVFNGTYPFIDLSSGGSLDGVIAAVERILASCDDKTRIIPGHGPLADKAALQSYHHVLATARERVAAAIKKGLSIEQVKAAKPLAEFDEKWGKAFVNPDFFLDIVYKSLTRIIPEGAGASEGMIRSRAVKGAFNSSGAPPALGWRVSVRGPRDLE